MNKSYTGIGSRECPLEILPKIKIITRLCSFKQYTLRSGGACGADLMFEITHSGIKEIYLPWKDFNDNKSMLFIIPDAAFELAKTYHPTWDKLSMPVKRLMARNCMQVLGKDLNSPSEFLVCWTPKGKMIGGTSQALRVAIDKKITIYNLYQDHQYQELINKLSQ